MFPEDGAIQIIDGDFGDQDWTLASAFTDEGLENLRYIIDETRLHVTCSPEFMPLVS